MWLHHNDLNWHPQLWQRHRSCSSPSLSLSPPSPSSLLLVAVVALNQTPPHFTLDDGVSPCPQELRLRSVCPLPRPCPGPAPAPAPLCTLLLVVWHCHDMIANRKMSRKITFPRGCWPLKVQTELCFGIGWEGVVVGAWQLQKLFTARDVDFILFAVDYQLG